MPKKIIVTGSSGTIGTRLCESLINDGFEVVGVDQKKNVWNQEIQDRTLIVDLRDKKLVMEKLPRDADAIIHLAANARVYNLVVDPSLARDNFETLFNVLEFARIAKIPKIIFSSSREVYGNSDKIYHQEDEAYVKNCESPYTASKVAGEALVHSYYQCYRLDFVIFRFSNVYGMYDGSDRVIPLFIERAKRDEDLIVFGKEKQLDFTYIDDCVNGIRLALQNFEKVKNDVFNLANGKGTTLLEVAQLIREMTDSKSKIILKENRTGEVVRFIADINKAKARLGYEPEITIIEGVKKSIAWYDKYGIPKD